MARPSPARAGGGCGGGPVALVCRWRAERLGAWPKLSARAGAGCGGGPVVLALGLCAGRLDGMAQTPRARVVGGSDPELHDRNNPNPARAGGGRQQRNIANNGAAKPCARGWWLRGWPCCAGFGVVGREVGRNGPNPARGWWTQKTTPTTCSFGQALRALVVAAGGARLRWFAGGGPRGWARGPSCLRALVMAAGVALLCWLWGCVPVAWARLPKPFGRAC